MLVHGDGHADDELGTMPPRQGIVTYEILAVNAVMAGCRPEYFPVVIAAVEAMLDPTFNLFAVQATTHPCAPCVIVNGPIAHELGINARYGAFGPGVRANATIGRAVRLTLMNVGGASPGVLDRSTQGQPAKYAYCEAENEAENEAAAAGRTRLRCHDFDGDGDGDRGREAAQFERPCEQSR